MGSYFFFRQGEKRRQSLRSGEYFQRSIRKKERVRNGVEIDLQIWVAYFVLNFRLKNGSYVDIMTVFKLESKDKRSSQICKFIFSPFLR